MKDSILHFLISLVGTIAFSLIASAFFTGMYAAIIGGVLMFSVGLAKEGVWDYLLKKGVPSLADINADATGIIAGMMIIIAVLGA